MFSIICSSGVGVEHVACQFTHDFKFQKQGFYHPFENQNFTTNDKKELIPIDSSCPYKKKIKKNVDIADAVLVLRKKEGYNNPNVDKTISYCTCKKSNGRFNFHKDKRFYKPCIVIMDALTFEPKKDSDFDIDVNKVLDFIKTKRVKSLYITGHGNIRRSPSELDWAKKVKIFLEKLFIALKDIYLCQPVDKTIEDVDSSVTTNEPVSLTSSLQMQFLFSSPTVDESPKTPSSARRLIDTEVVKETETSDSETMKRYILQQRTKPLFLDIFLKERLRPDIEEPTTDCSTKRQRNT